jgi:hypothetical protein
MTVQELIEELSNYDSNMEVKFAYNYGDYWRTEVADDIREIQEENVVYSSYHRTDKVVDMDDEQYEDVEDSKTVLILR